MKKIKEILETKIDKNIYNIILIAHVREPRGYMNLNQIQCSETERFSIEEFYEIYSGIVNAGYFIKKTYFNELDFIEDYLIQNISNSNDIVFNLARNGIDESKKTFIPSFCDLVGIPYTTSSSFASSLARNKLYFSNLLNYYNISVPRCWTHFKNIQYENLKYKVIKKPISESASQNINNESILIIGKDNISNEDAQNNEYFYQEYIEGYECEVPLFKYGNNVVCLDPVGIDLKENKILTYEASFNDNYNFFSLKDLYSKQIIENIKKTAIDVFKLMKLDIYGRVDFRITKDGKFYVIDISTTPYITKHSSFYFSIKELNLNYEDIFDILIKSTYNKFNNLKR